MIYHITITTLHHPSPTYSGIDQQEAFPTMYIFMLVTVLTLTKIIEIPTLSPRKFAPLAYFDKYICRRLVASQAVLLARVLLVSMAVGVVELLERVEKRRSRHCCNPCHLAERRRVERSRPSSPQP